MWKLLKAVSGSAWLVAGLIWFVATFAFIGGLEDAWGGTEPATVLGVLSLQASLAFQVFRAVATWPFRVGTALLLAAFCPLFVVPVLALLSASVERWWKRRPDVRLWFQATGGWFVLAGIVSVLGDISQEPGRSAFFGGLFLFVFGPFMQVLRFLSGPSNDTFRSSWWISLLASPLIWVPIFHRCLRLWHRSLARAGKEKPLPEPNPELEDTSNEGL